MNRISIKYRGPLRGDITPPPDKSISHRAVIISSLSEGKSIIRNFLRAEDPMRTLAAFRQMGIIAEDNGKEIIINGKGLAGLKKPETLIDCGNSGSTMRFLCGVLAGQPFSALLTGDSSLIRRPMQRIINPLSEMGADIRSEKGGYPPLHITGGLLKPICHQSQVASAQVKSAVLFAGLYCEGVTSFIEPEKSRDHTERMLKAAGGSIEIKNLEVRVKGRAKLRPLDISVPGDFSSAAFFITAGAIVPDSEIVIRDTGVNPSRTGLVDILRAMGADIRFKNERGISGEPVADIFIRYSRLTGADIESRMILRAIDEFPALCVAASVAHGTTKITGAKELRVKESDRIASMAHELRRMGAAVEEFEDGVVIEGRERLKSTTVRSYGDHRVAMAMTVAGLASDGETIIEDTDCISTSFPGFKEMLDRIQNA